MPPFFRFKVLTAAVVLSGCAPMIDTHGDALDADDPLKYIVYLESCVRQSKKL